METKKHTRSDASLLLSITELQKLLGVGIKLSQVIGKAAGAQVRIGQRTYYLRDKIIRYLEDLAATNK